MPKGMKVKSSGSFEGEGELNHNTPSVCRLLKGHISNILGTVPCVKLKLTELAVDDFELTKDNICTLMLPLLLILLILLPIL